MLARRAKKGSSRKRKTEGRPKSVGGSRAQRTPSKRRSDVSPPKKGRQSSTGGARFPSRTPSKPKRAKTVSPIKRYKIAVKTRVKLREGIEILRKHIRGYEAQNGYALSQLDTWDAKKRRRIITRAAKIRELTVSPHDTIKARTQKERKSLHQFTGQRIRGAKHYIVHKPADNFRVRLIGGRVDIRGQFAGGVETSSRFFLFPRRPRRPKELVTMARQLQKEMPAGFYTILTAAHGDTGEPFERDQIINRLNEYLAAYDVDSAGNPTGFSEALLGFRFMETTLDGAVVQRQQIDARRQRQKDFNRRKRALAEIVERKKIRRRLK